MCLILFAWRQHPDYPLVIAANRDEFHQRPSAPLDYWADPPILAGRDLQAGGTWLGADARRRMAAVTNLRGALLPTQARSRGDLTREFLAGGESASDYARRVHAERRQYSGFNLLLADSSQLWYVGSDAAAPRQLPAGIYALANAGLDTPWPKAVRGKQALAHWLRSGAGIEALLTLLTDTHQPPGDQLPDTGLSPELERRLASIFIVGDTYGTRSSSALLYSSAGDIRFRERRYGPGSLFTGETDYRWDAHAERPARQAGWEAAGDDPD